MHGFSIVDGFVDISERLAEMIKYLAHEPSVGLFFIQQHCQKTVPNVIHNNKNVVGKSQKTKFHTEDLKDSLTMVQSMKECGIPIAEDMIRDIRTSLETMKTKQPKRELIRQLSSFDPRQRSFWGSFVFNSQAESDNSGSYFSSFLRSTSSRNLSFPQLDIIVSTDSNNPPLPVGSVSSLPGMETDEALLSSQFEDAPQQFEQTDIGDKLLSVSEKYDDFKAIKEAQLEIWLDGTSNPDDNINGQAHDAERH